MGEPDAFLTDERRDVLNDEYDGAENVERTHQSRIKARSRSAIDELIEVAESPKINNGEVFDPVKLRYLLTSISRRGGLAEEDYQHVSDAYRHALYVEIDQFLRDWNDE